jgi:hypothetical protein
MQMVSVCRQPIQGPPMFPLSQFRSEAIAKAVSAVNGGISSQADEITQQYQYISSRAVPSHLPTTCQEPA